MRRDWMLAATSLAAALAARALARRWLRYDLSGRVAVIAGGSRGLGLVLARQLVDHGARVAICARRPEEVDAAVRELVDRGGIVTGEACDITNADQVGAFLSRVRDQLGPIDVLINNAGVIEVGPMEHMTMEDYRTAMAVHFWGPLQATLAVLPEMRERREGRIVNIASIGGVIAVPHLLPYSASKFALVGLSEGMRAELARAGVYVTTAVPGLMRTGSYRNAMFKGKYRDEYAWFSFGARTSLTAISAERAAAQIIEAMRRGDPEVVVSIQAKLARLVHAIAPGLTQRMLGIVDRLLPGPGGIGEAHRLGYASAR